MDGPSYNDPHEFLRSEIEREARGIFQRFQENNTAADRAKSRRAAEQQMWENLASFGIGRQRTGAMADMIAAISEQVAALQNQAGPSAAAMANFRRIFEGGLLREELEDAEEHLETQSDGDRKATLDAKYAQPETRGWSVLWRQGERNEPPAFQMFFDGKLLGGDWDYIGQPEMQRCESAQAAWDFIDYLTDSEEGFALCIREDAVVVFVDEGSGWESLTQEEVPDAYR